MASVQEEQELIASCLRLRDLSKTVKVDLRISCKMALFLAMAAEQGLQSADPGSLIKKIVSDEEREKLQDLGREILQKAEAEEVYELVKKIARR